MSVMNNNKGFDSLGAEHETQNKKLTERQKLFCLFYIKSFNATQAALKSGYAPLSAHVSGCKLLKNPLIAAQIKKLKGKMREEVFLDAMDVLKRYIAIAFADMNDYVEFGTEEVPDIDPVTQEPVCNADGTSAMRKQSFLRFKDASGVDGALICEIKRGMSGMSLKLADRQRALDKLAQYFDLFPDRFKREIQRAKLEFERKKIEGENDDAGLVDEWLSGLEDKNDHGQT